MAAQRRSGSSRSIGRSLQFPRIDRFDSDADNFWRFRGNDFSRRCSALRDAGSFLSLNAQARSAKDLANQNAKTQKDLEDYKKDIVEKIENLKGEIARQNNFIDKTLDAKSAADNKLFVTTTTCYRELQNLAKGEYDKTKVETAERSLREAEALAANLDDADRKIVAKIVQAVMDLHDAADLLTSTGDTLKNDRQAPWNRRPQDFGKQMDALRDRSPFYNQKIQ